MRLKTIVVAAALAAIAVPAALAGTQAANPMGLLLAKGDMPSGPYQKTQTLRPAQLKPEVLGRTASFGARSAAYKAAQGATCGARYFTTETASGEKQAFSYVCVTKSAADAAALAKAFVTKKGEFLKQPKACGSATTGVARGSGIFRWCPYKAGSSYWSTSFLGIWNSGAVVAVYAHEYPEIEKRPDLKDVLPGLKKLDAKIKAAV
jgi:hypothetical protein